MDKLVSIILPVYNVEKYITKSIQSVLDQTYSNYELLIVNDGTPDKSIELVEKFSDDRIKIFHKENGGLSDARNYGLERANGEYVYFMDSDDWIEPNLLGICIEAIEKFKSDFVIFGYFLDKEDFRQNLISTEKICIKDIVFEKQQNNLFFEDDTLGLMGYAWNKFYRTSFLNVNKLKFEKGISLVEDILFNSRVYEISDQIVFINKALYHYIDRPTTSLIKIFHKDSFELNIKKNKAINRFLCAWNTELSLKNKILADGIVIGIRYCINNLFAYKNNLSFKGKISYLKMMLNHEETRKYIYSYQPKSISDKVYKQLIISKAVVFIYLLCKIKK